MRILTPLAALCALTLAACAPATVRIYDAANGAPTVVPVVAASDGDSTGEPAVCLFAWHGNHFVGELGALRDAGRFRSLFLLTDDHLDPRGCGVLLSIRQSGSASSMAGTSYVDVYSAHGGEQVLRAQAEGGWGPYFGFQSVARHLKAELQRGRALRTKLDKLKATKPLVGGDEVLRLAEGGILTWDSLIAVTPDAEGKSQLAAARERIKASADEAVSSDEDASEETQADEPDTAGAAPEEPVAVASDLDDLPGARARDPHAHAVVIGIERYREKLPNADFSESDARLVAEYFKRVLGVPAENLALLVGDHATNIDFQKYFGRWLPNRVQPGDTVYVYYSGHGAPNPAKGDAYLVPYDGDPTYIEQTGYPVRRMYEDLAKLPAKSVLVAMDSCFSGAGGRSVIAKGARPLVSLVQNEVPANITVIAASAGDQISNSYQEKGHGLFTYFLLKGLKEKGGDFKAVYDYLKPEVARTARQDYNADQEPQWRQGR